MSEETKYLVNVEADTAIIAVVGKAGYMNCKNAGDFLSTAIESGCKRVIIQCRECTGMDSTFLGMIASSILKLRKINGELVMLNLSKRNLELFENLGLLDLVKTATDISLKEEAENLDSSVASNADILKAHESLVDANSANLAKFQDVITFLKKENNAN